jgi:hypothetical protein
VSGEIEVTVDTTDVKEKLDEVDRLSKRTLVSTLNTVRRGWDSIIQFAALTGQAIDQSYQLMAQSLFVAAETLIAIATAEAATVALAVKSAFSFGLAIALMGKGLEILHEGEAARLEVDNVIGLASIWRLY